MTAKVLVVDDIPANVRLLQAKLEADYYDVVTAHSGAEAIDMAILEQPDIILLDVMMPGVDGYEVTGRQSRYHGSHLVVLLACSNLSR